MSDQTGEERGEKGERRKASTLPSSPFSSLSSVSCDLLIANGTVVDGTGAPAYQADVAIQGDRICAIRSCLGSTPAGRVIDAGDLLVCPGFVDIHSHSDLLALVNRRAESRVFDGVTTEICGNCGSSYFPATGEIRKAREEGLAKYDLQLSWERASGYFRRLEDVGAPINRGFLVGHGTIRAAVMGFANRRPDAAEAAVMRRHVHESISDGAFGLSSGLIYSPGCFAEIDEIAALCEVVADARSLYATHMRSEGEHLLESVAESLEIARRSGVALQINHLKASGRKNWHKIEELEKILSAAIDDGTDLGCDRYPYCASSTGLDALFPNWISEGGLEKQMERLRTPEIRQQVIAETEEKYAADDIWHNVRISSVESDANRQAEGATLSELGHLRKQPPWEACLDLLVEENCRVGAVMFLMSEQNLRRILAWPFVVAASDGSSRSRSGPGSEGKPHPRAYGTFSRTFALCFRQEKLLSLEETVAKLSGRPAARMRLKQRGILREGCFADVVILDPQEFQDRATYDDPHQPSAGVRHLLVNGSLVIEDGRQTDALPGRVLRNPRA